MDEDLFNFDEELQFFNNPDDDTAKENYSENSVEQFLLSFACSGEDQIKFNFQENGFARSNFLNNILDTSQVFPVDTFEIFEFTLDEEFLLEVENFMELTNMARKNVQKLILLSSESSAGIFDTDFLVLRSDVTKLLNLINANVNSYDDPKTCLNILRTVFGTFDSMPNFSVIHVAHCVEGNKSRSAQYHLVHGQLEWRLIFLTILFKIQTNRDNLKGSDFETEIKLLIFDLVTLSISKFNKCNSSDVIFKSPFNCTCIKETWYLIQQLISRHEDALNTFWNYFNEILDHVSENSSTYSKFPEHRILLRSSSQITCKNPQLFSIWLLCGLVKLYGFDHSITFIGPEAINSFNSQQCENFERLELLVKNYLKAEQSEENLRVILFMVSEVLTEWWSPRSEIIMHFWEHFQKQINSPFVIAGQTPNFLAVTSNTAVGFLQQIKEQQSLGAKLNINTASFTMFVHILGRIACKFTQSGQKMQIQKILGRIYSKFPASKMLQLNEMGILNIVRLFVTIVISADIREIGPKICDNLLQIPLEKVLQQRQLTVMKGHMAMLILMVENQMNVSQFLTKLLTQINSLCEKSESGFNSVLKILAEGMNETLVVNEASGFENGETILLDSWIVKYLNTCTSVEQDRLYESLTTLIQKLRSDATRSSDLVIKLNKIILPYVKQSFSKSTSIWLPELAANLCLLSTVGISAIDAPKFDDIFKFFVELNCGNIENNIKFIVVIINSDKFLLIDRNLIIRHWIKFSVLLSGNHKDLKALTASIVIFKEFREICTSCVDSTDDFLNSKEPLCVFLSDFGKKYDASNNLQRCQLSEKFSSFFNNFEKWTQQYIQQVSATSTQANTPQKMQPNQEIILRIYTIIALTFLNCSQIIYVRSKTSCFFNVTMSQFLLPCSLMVGKQQSTPVVASIAKTWHVLIDGIGKLDFKGDLHLGKCLTDLIVKWTPQLKISTNSKVVAKPFINLMNLKNLEVINFVWDKISKAFILLQNRQPNPHCCLVLTVMEEVLHVTEHDAEKLLIVARNTVYQLFDHAMMSEDTVPTKNIIYGILERFVKNNHFDEVLKMLFVTHLKTITSKHLAYYSGFYFTFLTRIAKFKPALVKEIMEFLNSQILKVEQTRGSGRDTKLRYSFDKLQGMVGKCDR